MGVRFVTAQSTRHMHYTMTCLNGDCVVLVTITVTTDSYTREALCFSQCRPLCAPLSTMGLVCQICHSSVHKTHALYNDMSKW